MFYVYIVRCIDATLYTGFTTDIHRRISEHNSSKKGAKYTRGRTPVTLVYQQKFRTRTRALVREATLKKLTRREKLKLIAPC